MTSNHIIKKRPRETVEPPRMDPLPQKPRYNDNAPVDTVVVEYQGHRTEYSGYPAFQTLPHATLQMWLRGQMVDSGTGL